MGFLRGLSKFLMIFPVGVFLYDLIYEFAIKNRFRIRTLKELGNDVDKPLYQDIATFMKGFITSWDKFADWPAPLALLVLPVFLYIVYRIIFMLSGGRGGDGFKFKSHD